MNGFNGSRCEEGTEFGSKLNMYRHLGLCDPCKKSNDVLIVKQAHDGNCSGILSRLLKLSIHPTTD